MCGRGVQGTGAELAAHFADLQAGPRVRAKPAAYNVAPTDVIVLLAGGRLTLARWGVPRGRRGGISINARSDRLGTHPRWRRLAREGRAIVPFRGFYEWTGPRRKRQPWLFVRRDGTPLLLASLYDERSQSAAIITTNASSDVVSIHDRMPVILDPAAAQAWVDTGAPEHLQPAPAGILTAHTVSSAVNDPREDGANLLERSVEPVAEQQELFAKPSCS